MAIPQTPTVLKNYFRDGAIPTGAQYAELIDTMFYLYQDAANQLEAALQILPRVRLVAKFTGGAWVIDSSVNVGAIAMAAGALTVSFTDALADALYLPLLGANYSSYLMASSAVSYYYPGPLIKSRAVGSVVLTLPSTSDAGGTANGVHLSVPAGQVPTVTMVIF